MPKSIYKIHEFDGGLVTHQSDRDIPDKALSVAQNIMVDIKGQIRLMGKSHVHPDFGNLSLAHGLVNPGYGLFALHHDYGFNPHSLITSIAGDASAAIDETTPTLHKKTVTTSTDHQLQDGSLIRIYGTASGTYDGIYRIEKKDDDEFYFTHSSATEVSTGTDGYVAPAPGAFRSLFLDDNGTIKIFQEFSDVVVGWVQNNQITTLALGCNYGRLDSGVSVHDYPENWVNARLNYIYLDGALRISNATHNDPTSLGNHDKYDWPIWLGYIDEKWFTDENGADIVGTVTWRPQWYQTIAHTMNPYEWNTIRNFYNRHDGSWGVDENDISDTSGSAGRAQQCFIYAYPGTAASASDFTGVQELEFDTNIRSDCSALSVNSMTILPGQFGVRMYSSASYLNEGDWRDDKIYKFGYSFYYDYDALQGGRLQDSEIIPMGGWSTAATNPSNCYLNAHAIDGCLNLKDAGADSEGVTTAFNLGGPCAVQMQVYLNTGGTSNETNQESNSNTPFKSFWPPRAKGIRVWLIGEVDAAGADGKITYIDDPLLTLEIDFKLGVRLASDGEFAKWEAVSGLAGSQEIEPDGSPVEEDFLVRHSTLISNEEPLETYSDINAYRHDRSYGAVKGKTDVMLNNCRYVGNVIADEGVSGAPHNVFDDSKRKLVTKSDHVFKSVAYKPDIFLKESVMTIGEENDGEEVVKVDSIGAQLLVWKENTLYVYDTTDGQEMLIQTYKHMGLLHPNAVTKVEKGIAWINKNGLFMYDGEKMGNAITDKINPKEWADFVGKDANLGYIPMNKQVVVFQSGVGDESSGNVYIFDVNTDSITYGENVLSPFTKSNTVSNYDGSLMYAGPKLDEVHKIETYKISDRSPGSIGRWVLKGLGDNLNFTNCKLTIKSTDITSTFSATSAGTGNEAIDIIINQIMSKCGVGTFIFEPNYELGTLAIVWPVTNASNGTYNAETLDGNLSITNPPVFPGRVEQTVLTTNYLSMLDGDNYEENHPQSNGYFMNFNGGTHETTGLRAIGMNTGGQATGNRSANSPIDVNILKEFGQFIISDVSGNDHILAADEALYTVDESVTLTSGSQAPYDVLINEAGNTYINTKGPNWTSFNFSTTISNPTVCNVSLPVFWVDTSFAGENTPFSYMYFSDPSMAKYFYTGLAFSFISEDIDMYDKLICINSEVIEYGDRKIGRLIVEGIIGSSGNSGYDPATGAFKTVEIDFSHEGTNNDYSTSGIGVDNVEIPNNEGGKSYYIVPRFNHTAGNADDLVTYSIDVSGNDGNSYQFQHTRAADEYLFRTIKNLKHKMEEANATQDIWKQSTNFEDTTYFTLPRVTVTVTFDHIGHTITDGSKTLRNYAQLLQPDCAFSITNAATSNNNRTYLVGSLVSTSTHDRITIDTDADTLTSADPSDISASIAAAGVDDEITIQFHSLYMQETVDRPYELFVNSGVYSGSQIYNFENIVDTDLVNVPKFSTKDVDLGAPGVRKNLIKVYVTVKNADNIFLKYTLNGADIMYDLRPAFGNAESISTTGSEKTTFELVPEYGAEEHTRKGFYSIQLHFSTSYPQSNFALDDISIVYRSLGVR